VRVAAALLVLVAAACNSAEPPPPVTTPETVRLTPRAPEAMLSVPKNGGKVLVEVTRVDNPELREVTLLVAFEGKNGAPQRFSLYPPDRAARLAVLVPDGARRMQVRIESSEKLPALVEVRVLPFPR
jgi:hypothetical protein